MGPAQLARASGHGPHLPGMRCTAVFKTSYAGVLVCVLSCLTLCLLACTASLPRVLPPLLLLPLCPLFPLLPPLWLSLLCWLTVRVAAPQYLPLTRRWKRRAGRWSASPGSCSGGRPGRCVAAVQFGEEAVLFSPNGARQLHGTLQVAAVQSSIASLSMPQSCHCCRSPRRQGHADRAGGTGPSAPACLIEPCRISAFRDSLIKQGAGCCPLPLHWALPTWLFSPHGFLPTLLASLLLPHRVTLIEQAEQPPAPV